MRSRAVSLPRARCRSVAASPRRPRAPRRGGRRRSCDERRASPASFVRELLGCRVGERGQPRHVRPAPRLEASAAIGRHGTSASRGVACTPMGDRIDDRGAPRDRAHVRGARAGARMPRRSTATTRSLDGSGRDSAISACSVRPCPRPTAAPGSASSSISWSSRRSRAPRPRSACRTRRTPTCACTTCGPTALRSSAALAAEAAHGRARRRARDERGRRRVRRDRLDVVPRRARRRRVGRERLEDVDHERAGGRRAHRLHAHRARRTSVARRSPRSWSSATWPGSASRRRWTSSACADRRPRRSSSRDCEIPDDQVLGEAHRGVRVLMSGLDSERLVLSGGPIGIMQAAMDLVLPYVRERRQFGKPIGSFELMQGKLADMYVALESSRAFAYDVARRFDREPGRRHTGRRGGVLAGVLRASGAGRARGDPEPGRRRLSQRGAGRAARA